MTERMPTTDRKSARLVAAENGQTHYEGRPCANCKTTLRYTSTSACVECNREASRAVRERIRELLEEARDRKRRAPKKGA